MERTFTLQEIKNYLASQDSFGDIHYNLNEVNIIEANNPATDIEVQSCNIDPGDQYWHKSLNSIVSVVADEDWFEDTIGCISFEEAKQLADEGELFEVKNHFK